MSDANLGLNLLPIFVIGLLGSVHCIGMCGGIVSALSASGPPGRVIPIAVAITSAPSATGRVIAYNGGRIASYMLAGAIAGGLASGARMLAGLAPLQIGAYWLANIMLIVLGLYLLDLWRGLNYLEAAGHNIWRQIQPLMKGLLPADTLPKSFALGALWGWLPCGMVYSMLLTAMLTATPLTGALVMLAFGLGTLPTMLTLGLLGARLARWSRLRLVRMGAGVLVLGFGVLGLARAAGGVSLGWLDLLCLGSA